MLRTLPAAVAVVVALLFAAPADAGRYLVEATGGPGPGSPADAVQLLEGVIIPTFDIIEKWEKDGTAVAGLPTGGRSFVMIVDVESNHALDVMLRSLPAWPILEWSVTPVEMIGDRSATERKMVAELKKGMK
ncbi:MAG TPA: hypothetical protein VKU85_00095 [bacterium]|nr:hypothetical protein [bacterium]